jgi:transcriptional regulator GlxA family with amidase domain
MPHGHKASTDAALIAGATPGEAGDVTRVRDAVLEAARELATTLDVLERTLYLLATAGVRDAAASQGVCERTLRRALLRSGASPAAVGANLRARVLLQLLDSVPHDALATALGYRSLPSFQRFVRATLGQPIRSLRRQRASATPQRDGPGDRSGSS